MSNITIGRAMLVAGLLAMLACERSEEASGLPNVVLIYADDLGFGDLGSYGATAVRTPNLDALAAGGIRFTDAHSSATMCSPSRYSLMTGRYAFRADNESVRRGEYLEAGAAATIPPDMETLPKLFERAGYATDAVGKWHLGIGLEKGVGKLLRDEDLSPGPLDAGFQSFYGFFGDRHFAPHAWAEGRRLLRDESGRLVSPRLHTTMDRLLDRALGIIDQRASEDRPFFLYFAPSNVHKPFTPAERFWNTSEAGPYGDFIVELDAAVGRIVEALRVAGELESTLILFSSDNGAPRQEHPGRDKWIRFGMAPRYSATYDARQAASEHRPSGPFRGRKGDLTEGGHRVPMILRWPARIPEGVVSDALVSQMDLMASFATLLDQPISEGAAEDSLDMLPLLLGEPEAMSPRGDLVIWRSGEWAVRSGDWKFHLARFRDAGHTGGVRRLLYNLGRDPVERRNLFRIRRERAEALEALLTSIHPSAGAP